jgi:UDP-N-acetylmuramate dehydrogenase
VEAIAGSLERLAPGQVRRDEPLARHVTFRIGGPADVLVLPRTLADLARVAAWLAREGERAVVLGRGSNVLIADRGVRGVVVKTGRGQEGLRFEHPRLVAECGVSMPYLARQAALRGLSGLEFAGGIPGSVGGAVVMNAGAHGRCTADVVRSVRVVRLGGETVWPVSELAYAYRESRLQHEDAVVLEAEFALIPEDPARTVSRLDEWLRHRSDTQPLGPPSSGCVFRNPPGDYAGRLIDHAGAKTMRVGGAVVSDRHANYILNLGGASASEVCALIERVRERVRARFGVALETEVKLLGEFDAA